MFGFDYDREILKIYCHQQKDSSLDPFCIPRATPTKQQSCSKYGKPGPNCHQNFNQAHHVNSLKSTRKRLSSFCFLVHRSPQ
uniref:Uncharacterized protein n=1 Tax=Tetranychus urticae TaxID=32264 RepID=T1KJU1_TETUR